MAEGSGRKLDAALVQSIQQLQTYLYALGENQAALLERIERLEKAGTGGAGVKSLSQKGNQLVVDYEDGRTTFLRVALDLPEREEVFYPWTYGLVYDNRNEVSAVTSGGGAWTIHTGANRQGRVQDQYPIPWDSVTLLTVSARDGDGVNRRKMFESATFDNGELIIALRRETGQAKSDFIQVAFQMTGDVIDNGDGTYGFPVTRSTLAQSYDRGDESLILPPLGGDYDLLLLLPALPDIHEFPSGRLAGWYWVDIEADLATVLEGLAEGAAWPEAAVEAAEAGTPGDNVPGDTVTLVRGDVQSTRSWDATRLRWIAARQIIDGNLVVHGTVNTDALAALAVTAPKMFIGRGLIAGNEDRLQLRVRNDGAITLDDDGIGIEVADTSLDVGRDGIKLLQGPNSGLEITRDGVQVGIRNRSGMTITPDGLGLEVAGSGGIAIGAGGIAIIGDTGKGIAVGANGVGITIAPNKGLVFTDQGLAIQVAGSNISIGPDGVRITVDQGPPGDKGDPGDRGPPGPQGPAIVLTSGNAALSIANNRITLNVDTASGIRITSRGVSFDGASVPRVWTLLRSSVINVGTTHVDYTLPDMTVFRYLAFIVDYDQSYGMCSIPLSALTVGTARRASYRGGASTGSAIQLELRRDSNTVLNIAASSSRTGRIHEIWGVST